MYQSDDKIVSITFNNKEFLNDVSTTIKALENLNDITSGKALKTTGISNLESAFSNLNKNATSNIDSINNAVSNTSAYTKMSESIEESSRGFSLLEGIAVGAMISIGNSIINYAVRGINMLTSGIRSGWGEYNLLIDSTQTILSNTERYGTSINEVTAALDNLNDYADKTIYNFAQMTRNVGYFTAAGSDLEASITAIRGMANLAALVGASSQQLTSATFQTSQAMAQGRFQAMDWMSIANNSMGGMILQEELIRVAALMSGDTYEHMKEFVDSWGSFKNSLQAGWLTADVFAETMRRFAGMTREEVEAIRDLSGNALPEDEIERIVHLGEAGIEAAQKVRTLGQMMESVGESIGSGWTETFRLIIGDLEKAKEFWSPINQVITEVTGGVGAWRNAIVKSWADVWRTIAVNDMTTMLSGLSDILKAVGEGFARAFGSTHQIAGRIGRITEAIGDLAETLKLDEEELADITDLTEGLLSPIKILLDIVNDLVLTFFNAGDAMNEFDTRTDSIIDSIKPIRKMILNVVGAFGRLLSKTTEIIRQSGVIQSTLHVIFVVIKKLSNVVISVIGGTFRILAALWNRYNMTEKVLAFINVVYNAIMGLKEPLYEIINITETVFRSLKNSLMEIDFTPLTDFKNILYALKDIFIAIVNPTISVSDAIHNFIHVFANTSINKALLAIRRSFELWYNAIKNSSVKPYVDAIVSAFKTLLTVAKYVIGALILGAYKVYNILKSTNIKEYLGNIIDVISNIYNKLKSTNFGGFIIGIVERIRSAIESLISIFRGSKVTSEANTFIQNIKNVLETKDELSTPNVFTVIKGMSDGIKDVVSSLADPKEYGPIKDTLGNIKDIADKATDTLRSGDLSSIANPERLPKFFTVVRDIILTIVDKIKDISVTVYTTLKTKLQAFSDALQLLASGERYRDLDNVQKIADIIEMFNSIFARIASSVIIFMHILSVFKLAVAIAAVGEAVGAIARSVKRFATANIMKSIATIFVTFAALAAIFIGGAYLISKYADVDVFDRVFSIFVKKLLLIFGVMLTGMAVITFIATGAGKLSKKSQLDTAKILRSVSKLINSFGRVLVVLVGLIALVSYVSFKVAEMSEEQRSAFMSTTKLLMNMFIGMMLIFSAVVLIGTLCGNVAKTLISSADGMFIANSSLLAVSHALSSIALAMASLVLSIGAAMAVMLYLSPNTEKLEKVGNIIKDFMWAFIALMGVILLFTTLAGPTMAVDVTAISQMIRTMATSFIGIMLAVSVLASVVNLIMTSMTAITATLAGIADQDKIDKMKLTIMSIFDYVMGIFVAIGVFVLLSGVLAKYHQISPVGMLAFAGSVLLITMALVATIQVITASIVALEALSGPSSIDKSIGKINRMLATIGAFMGVIAVSILAIGAAASQLPGLTTGMLAGAGAIMIIVGAISLLSFTLSSLTLINSDKLVEAATVLGVMFGVISILLAGLAAIGLASKGFGTVALLAAAAGIFIFAEAMLVLSRSMKTASIAISIFSNSLKLLEAIDMKKVSDNLIELVKTLPKVLNFLVNNAGNLQASLTILFRLMGVAMAEGIWMFVHTSITLITAGAAGIIEGMAAPITGILYAIMDIIIGFLRTELGEGGQIRQLVVILEDFLVWFADDIGYYGILIGVALLQGIWDAIMYEGWDLRLAGALYTVWVGVRKIMLDKLGFNDFRTGAELFGFNLLADIAIGLLDAVGFVEFVLDRIFEIVEEFIRDAVGDEIWGVLVDTGIFGASQWASKIGDATQGLSDEWQEYRNTRTLQIVDNMVDTTEDELENLELMNSEMDRWIEERRSGEFVANIEGGNTSLSNLSTYASQARDSLSSLGDTIRGFLGIPEGGILASITDALGLGDINSLGGLFSGFGDAGNTAGTDWMAGFADATNASSGNLLDPNAFNYNIPDVSSNVSNWMDPDKVNEFNDAVTATSELPEELENPVITPVWDDTQLRADAQSTVDWWNNSKYDEFAIDANNSMLLREQTDGDASTDGNVTYNFTQYNTSPEALSPIQIYRDTRNLIRGRINA